MRGESVVIVKTMGSGMVNFTGGYNTINANYFGDVRTLTIADENDKIMHNKSINWKFQLEEK